MAEPGLADAGGPGAGLAKAEGTTGGGARGPVPAWVATVERNVERNRKLPYAKYMQLATVEVGEDGTPAPRCRTVVYRGIRRELQQPQRLTGDVVFCTDRRSEKMRNAKQLGALPGTPTEICWYFPDTREQVRIHGLCYLVGGDEGEAEAVASAIAEHGHALPPSGLDLQKLRRSLWKAMSDGAREQFDWAHPKAPLDVERCAPTCDADGVSANFVYGVVVPSYVDHLVLKGTQVRFVHFLDGHAQATARALSCSSGSPSNSDEAAGWRTLEVHP